jgi:methylmalonyl-CoA epimerase
MAANPICDAKNIHHTAIAVKDLDASIQFYQATFGAIPGSIAIIEDQEVRAVLLSMGHSNLELIEPTSETSGVARFIEKRGEGIHHVCFEVANINNQLKLLEEAGITLIDKESRPGLSGMIGFIHPKSSGGVLIELTEPRDTP